jgi:predicted DsbA family dithiol-disulfide isomerase
VQFGGRLYFDFVCPYVNRLARLLGAAERDGVVVDLNWRPFSLEQVNSQDPDLRYWEAPERSHSGGIHALASYEWVRANATFAEVAYRRALLFLRHDEEASFSDWTTFERAAGMAGLEGEELVVALRDRGQGYEQVGLSFEEARSLGVFGVPTLVREGRDPLFIKLTPPALDGDAGQHLEIIDQAMEAPGVWELKKPG